MLNQCPPVQKLGYQPPQPLLAVRQPVIAIREKMHLYFLKGAAGGEFRDTFPGHRGVELPLDEQGRGLVAGQEGLGGVGAEVFDQGPAELGGDEFVLEVDLPRLLPAAGLLGAGPGEEPFFELQRGGDMEPRHDLLGVQGRVPEGRPAAHRGAEEDQPAAAPVAEESVDPGHVLQIARQRQAGHVAAREAMPLEVEGAEAEARLSSPDAEEFGLLARLLRAEAVEIEEAGALSGSPRRWIESYGEVGDLAAVLDDGDSLHAAPLLERLRTVTPPSARGKRWYPPAATLAGPGAPGGEENGWETATIVRSRAGTARSWGSTCPS